MPPLRSGRPFIPGLKSPGFSGRSYKFFSALKKEILEEYSDPEKRKRKIFHKES